MVTVNPANAIKAYSGTARAAVPNPTGLGGNSNSVAPQDFSSLVENGLKGAIEGGKAAEAQSFKAVAGQAEITDVVSAVANAELTLQTVVAVRDKVVSAYQEIMRMPI
ncbi:MAG: flagellar hook-basal body complex protein FliE [Candidatus Pacebacteria bacterium]|nr:flagellar hook-basal body complex protein FliE [Candidatus Paceibacterota bacterium]